MIKRKRHIVQHSRIRKEKVRQISNLHQCKVIFAMVSTRDTYPNFTHVGWKRATWHTNIIFSSSVHINMAWFQASSIITIPSALSSTHSSQHNQTEVIFLQKKNIMYETKKKNKEKLCRKYEFSHFGQKSLLYQDFTAYSPQDETLQLHISSLFPYTFKNKQPKTWKQEA